MTPKPSLFPNFGEHSSTPSCLLLYFMLVSRTLAHQMWPSAFGFAVGDWECSSYLCDHPQLKVGESEEESQR